MNGFLVRSDGTWLGTLWLPPFAVQRGQFHCLHVTGPLHDLQEQDRLANALTGAVHVAGLHVAGHVLYAKQPVYRSGIFGLLPRPRIESWLRRTGGMTPAATHGVCSRLRLEPSRRLSELAGNPKTMLALEAAWARRAEAVVFTTGGWCDPSGCRTVLDAVKARLGDCAAIHLSFADIHGKWHCREDYPDAVHLTLERRDVVSNTQLTPR
jgi:hypothetical protein